MVTKQKNKQQYQGEDDRDILSHSGQTKFRWPAQWRPVRSKLFEARRRRTAGEPDLLSVTAVAKIMNTSDAVVLQSARSGKLVGAKFGKSWVFLRNCVIDYVRRESEEQTKERHQRAVSAATPLAQLVVHKAKTRRKAPPALPNFNK